MATKRVLLSTSKQTFLTQNTSSFESNVSFLDLCQALIGANIPWNKLSNPNFRDFLENYCNWNIPLRKTFLDQCYQSALQEIQDKIGDSPIYGVVDETTDDCHRHVANFLVRKLTEDDPGTPYLIASKFLEKTNYSTVARFVNDSLRLLWQGGRGN